MAIPSFKLILICYSQVFQLTVTAVGTLVQWKMAPSNSKTV